jgi:hypothetical protein
MRLARGHAREDLLDRSDARLSELLGANDGHRQRGLAFHALDARTRNFDFFDTLRGLLRVGVLSQSECRQGDLRGDDTRLS